MTRPQRLTEALAEALVDGHEVDWRAAERSAPDERLLQLVKNFETLSNRFGRAERTEQRISLEAETVRGNAPVPLWERAVIALAGVQLGGAILGMLAGNPDSYAISPLLPTLSTIVFAVSAVWVFYAGRKETRAIHLCAFLVVNAVASGRRFLNWAVPYFPSWLGHSPFFNALQPEAFFAAFLWMFVREFPRVIRFGRYERVIRWGTRLSVTLGWGLFAANAWAFYSFSGRPSFLALLTRQHPSGIYWAAGFALSMLAIGTSLLRLADAPQTERARVWLFVTGLGVGLGPLLVDVVLYYLFPNWYRPFLTRLDPGGWRTPVIYSFVMLVPVVASASVAMEDPHMTMRRIRALGSWQTLRMVSGVLAAGTCMVSLTYVYLNRDKPINETFGRLEPALAIASMFAVAYLLLPGLRSLLAGSRLRRLDARSPPNQGANARSLKAILENQIGGLFQPKHIFLLVPGVRDELLYEAVYGDVRPLHVESALFSIALDNPTPIRTWPDSRSSVFRWLPLQDRDWVLDANVALLVPVFSADGTSTLGGFLGIGPRAVDRDFTADDERVIVSLAAALSLALKGLYPGQTKNVSASKPFDEPAGECPSCGIVWQKLDRSCSCGSELRRAPVPSCIAGKYHLQRRIGQGSMGVVYAAEDSALGRTVAVKTLPRVSPETLLRFRQEARAMARVSHPNVATIFGVESWRGVPMLLVEHMDGGTLEKRLGSPHEIQLAVNYVVAIADGLGALHREGLVHRDVKPSNIGLTRGGMPKLMDFGLARESNLAWESVVERPASPRVVIAPENTASYQAGTPLYLPPECWGGRVVAGVDQDLWALSMIFYELVVGKHPLKTEGEARAEGFASSRMRELTELSHTCPRALLPLLGTALSPNPAQRPRDAETWKRLILKTSAAALTA